MARLQSTLSFYVWCLSPNRPPLTPCAHIAPPLLKVRRTCIAGAGCGQNAVGREDLVLVRNNGITLSNQHQTSHYVEDGDDVTIYMADNNLMLQQVVAQL